MNRRTLILGLAAVPLAAPGALAAAAMIVFKDPNCGCCGAWVDHVKAAGFSADVRMEAQMDKVKARLRVPDDLASCHTAQIDGYVIEGHVPAEVIQKLLKERPKLLGLAVPGMPIGSPGMETPGYAPEPFKVFGFTATGAQIDFADYPRGWSARG